MTRPNPPVYQTDALALAGVAAQGGCVTLVVVLVSLIAGIALDRALGTQFIFTILLILASVPVSLYLMLRTVLSGMARFHAQRGNEPVASDQQPIGGLWRKPGTGDTSTGSEQRPPES